MFDHIRTNVNYIFVIDANNVKNLNGKDLTNMKKTELAIVVSVLLGEKAITCEDYGPNEVLVELVDINQEINGQEVFIYLREGLLMQDYEEIEFYFYDENENLLIVSAMKAWNDFEETRLTTLVLSLLGEDMIEYENNYPDSISIRLINSIPKHERASICNNLIYVLKAYDFENCFFEDDGHWLTIFAKDSIDHYTKNSKLTTVVLTLLQEVVEEYKEFGQGMVAVNVNDCNMKFQDKEMTVYLKEGLLLQGFEDIQFTIHQDNSLKSYWLIVEAQESQYDDRLSNLAISVLTLIGNDVYEYGQYYFGSISIELFDYNKMFNGKKVCEFLKDALELQGYKDIDFYNDNGNWLTVFATEPENVATTDLATAVLELLGYDLFGYKKIAPGFFTMKLKDSKKKYGGKDVHTYLEEALKLFGYKELQFNYGDDNWLTIVAKQPQTI